MEIIKTGLYEQERDFSRRVTRVIGPFLALCAMTLMSPGAPGDYSCPEGSNMVCVDAADTVCPASARCVSNEAICLDEKACNSARGYICGSDYDDVLLEHEQIVHKYNQLTSENVELRDERLERRNCVINAATLKEAIGCVRSQH